LHHALNQRTDPETSGIEPAPVRSAVIGPDEVRLRHTREPLAPSFEKLSRGRRGKSVRRAHRGATAFRTRLKIRPFAPAVRATGLPGRCAPDRDSTAGATRSANVEPDPDRRSFSQPHAIVWTLGTIYCLSGRRVADPKYGIRYYTGEAVRVKGIDAPLQDRSFPGARNVINRIYE
jgi:hypothetical protein